MHQPKINSNVEISPYCFSSAESITCWLLPTFADSFLVLVVDDDLQSLLEGADRLRASQTVLPPLIIWAKWEERCRLFHSCARPWLCVQGRELIVWPRATVYWSKACVRDKPAYNSVPTNDFQRSLSFAAIQSSFDKMLVEMDQNTCTVLKSSIYL